MIPPTQIVRCRFLTVEPGTGRIRITLTSAKAAAAAAETDGVKAKGPGVKGSDGGDPCGGLKPGGESKTFSEGTWGVSLQTSGVFAGDLKPCQESRQCHSVWF
jgi:hypothetical protein